MALTDKLTAIADAIREKSGKTDTMTLDTMAEEISNLSAEELITPSQLPDYVRQEIERVATEARKYITDDSIVFLAMSDGHYYADEGAYSEGLKTNTANEHAAMALKALTYLLPVDFVAHLGDFAWGASTTTPEIAKRQIEGFTKYIQEAKSDLPVFYCIGNHDPAIYYH